MQGKLIILRENGEKVEEDVLSLRCLHQLQTAVGGSIELVPYFEHFEGRPCVAFCNEDGKINGLKINHPANNAWAIAQAPYIAAPIDDVLVGPIAIVVGDDDFLREL